MLRTMRRLSNRPGPVIVVGRLSSGAPVWVNYKESNPAAHPEVSAQGEPAEVADNAHSGEVIRRALRWTWVAGFVGEQAGEFGMFHDHGRVALDGVEVALLEPVAGLRGCEHLTGEHDRAARVVGGHRNFSRQALVEAHHEFGNIVQPRELFVVNYQAEQFAGVDLAMDALIFAAFHIEQSLVQLKEGEPQGD